MFQNTSGCGVNKIQKEFFYLGKLISRIVHEIFESNIFAYWFNDMV